MKAKTVELHLIQSFPPSCVNRDGNNSPKDCTFGDVRRARISSQCLKRAIREASIFAETAGPSARRSRWWVDELAKDKSLSEQDDRDLLITLMSGLIGGIEEGDEEEEVSSEDTAGDGEVEDSEATLKSKVLLHLPRTAGDAVFPVLFKHRELVRSYRAEAEKSKATKGEKGKKKSKNPHQKEFAKVVKELVNEIQKLPPAPDLALYGRMLANNLGLNIDASAQVAHAISTHKLSQEMDYWTAVDDFQPKSEPGAGMLGTAEFNASTFYRYACVSLPILFNNLNQDEEMVKKTIEGFLLASYDAIPTGKLNGHAHFTPPVFALAVVRTKGMPLNLANAFLDPVRAKGGKDVGAASADALMAHLQRMRQMAPVDEATYCYAHALPADPDSDGVQKKSGYGELVRCVMEGI